MAKLGNLNKEGKPMILTCKLCGLEYIEGTKTAHNFSQKHRDRLKKTK